MGKKVGIGHSFKESNLKEENEKLTKENEKLKNDVNKLKEEKKSLLAELKKVKETNKSEGQQEQPKAE